MTRLLRDIGYFCVLVLMIIGVGGIIYHAVRKDGWVEGVMGGVFGQSVGTALVVLAGLAVAAWLARRWLIASQRHALFNDFLMYGMVALGVIFLGRWLLQGSF